MEMNPFRGWDLQKSKKFNCLRNQIGAPQYKDARGCTTEFLTIKFWGFLKVTPSKNDNFHVKVTQKKFGDIL